MTAKIQRRSFTEPDQVVQPWDKVDVEALEVLGKTLARVTTQPGWNWREHAADRAGADRCLHWHVKLLLSWRLAVAFEDGTQATLEAGDVAVLEPHHDAWVVGDEPVASSPWMRCSRTGGDPIPRLTESSEGRGTGGRAPC